jgi:hypothetical protein
MIAVPAINAADNEAPNRLDLGPWYHGPARWFPGATPQPAPFPDEAPWAGWIVRGADPVPRCLRDLGPSPFASWALDGGQAAHNADQRGPRPEGGARFRGVTGTVGDEKRTG